MGQYNLLQQFYRVFIVLWCTLFVFQAQAGKCLFETFEVVENSCVYGIESEVVTDLATWNTYEFYDYAHESGSQSGDYYSARESGGHMSSRYRSEDWYNSDTIDESFSRSHSSTRERSESQTTATFTQRTIYWIVEYTYGGYHGPFVSHAAAQVALSAQKQSHVDFGKVRDHFRRDVRGPRIRREATEYFEGVESDVMDRPWLRRR